jgi:hypothetical protein
MTISSIIMVEASSVKVRAGGPATANLWVVIDGREFPSRGWNDFVVVVLGWWAAALILLFRGVSTRESVSFMDGPYSVEISRPSSGTLQFRALEGAMRANESALGSAPAFEFALSLISQGRVVLEACRQRNWWSSDAETLQLSLLSLEEECRRTFPPN